MKVTKLRGGANLTGRRRGRVGLATRGSVSCARRSGLTLLACRFIANNANNTKYECNPLAVPFPCQHSTQPLAGRYIFKAERLTL